MSATSRRPSAVSGESGASSRRQANAASRRASDARVERALGDPALQQVLRDGQDYVQALSAPARSAPDWPLALDEVARVRAATLSHLDRYVEEFASNVEKSAATSSSPPTPPRRAAMWSVSPSGAA